MWDADPPPTPCRGAAIPEGSLTGGTEFAYGVRPGIECGVYLPILSIERSGVALDINGRALSQRTFTAAVQPIVGGRWQQFTLAINLNLDTGFDGIGKVRFSPAERLAFELSPVWTAGLEHYSDWGPFAHLPTMGEIQHQVFVVAQRTIGPSTIEAGLGRGFSPNSDRVAIKLDLSFEL